MTYPSPSAGPTPSAPVPSGAPALPGGTVLGSGGLQQNGAKSPGKATIWSNLDANLANAQYWWDTAYNPVNTGAGHAGDREAGRSRTLINSSQQVLTGDQIMKNMAAMASAKLGSDEFKQFVDLQKELALAGYYGDAKPGSIRGGWSGQTEAAFADALTEYYQAVGPHGAGATEGAGTAMSFRDFLAGKMKANIAVGGPGSGAFGGARPSVQVNLTDPAALALYAQKAAQAALGHSLSQKQIDAFVTKFHSQQSADQTTMQMANATNQNATATQPDAQAEAVQYAQQIDPQGYSNHAAQGYTNALLDLFLPSGSQRPGLNPTPDIGALGAGG